MTAIVLLGRPLSHAAAARREELKKSRGSGRACLLCLLVCENLC